MIKNNFIIETRNNVVVSVCRSSVNVPEVKWNGQGIKWFDDEKLRKKVCERV